MPTRQDAIVVTLPDEIASIVTTIENGGFEAYLVGGCVRDLLLGRKPKDWDITTNAKPEEIIGLFPKTFYENDFGTVGVVNEAATDETVKIVEVTPYRTESKYSDGRRPDIIQFSTKIEDDLKRRDFTVNAIAMRIAGKYGVSHKGHILDLYKGQEDMALRQIKTVGNAGERFSEDGLRILRAVRLSAELGFTINHETEKAIVEEGSILAKISKERIRDEFAKIIMSEHPMDALKTLQKLSILQYIAPELAAGIGCEQNQAHSFDVWEHLLRSLEHSAKKKLPLEVRLAALFHDVGKPATRRKGENGDWTFYGHEVIGARMANIILSRLKFPVKTIEKAVTLIRWHMFFSDTEKITLSAVRRIVAKVGKDNVWHLMDVRACDRIGTGRPKETPYRLRKYKSMLEEAMRDPISVGMLKIDGNGIITAANIAPGPKIGHILHALFEEVLDDPKKNTTEFLRNRAVELAQMPEQELKMIGERGKEKKEEEEIKAVGDIRKKYWVE